MCEFLRTMYEGETRVKVKVNQQGDNDANGHGAEYKKDSNTGEYVYETKKTCPPLWVRDALVEGAGMKKVKTLFKWDECIPGADMPQPEA